MDGCKEICQRQTEMEKARRPMFQQELEELKFKVRFHSVKSVLPCGESHEGQSLSGP